MKRFWRNSLIVGGSLAVIAGIVTYEFFGALVPIVGGGINFFQTLSAPAGTFAVETSADAPTVSLRPTSVAAQADWPGYNRSLTSERWSPLAQITVKNVPALGVVCTYDTHQHTSFQTGPIVVNGALIATTEHDIFSLDPANCHQNWRTHENYKAGSLLAVNRGAAYLDGRLFRGTQDGRVLAYDFTTGKRLWATTIANAAAGETTPAAPIAWNGLVFMGNAGGDTKGVKGRMYALDAATGKIVWEFYLVPKSPDDIMRGPQGKTPLNRSTWRNKADTPITGGAVWTSFTLDPATGRLYVPGGNPAPDFAVGPRKGENLYSGSVVVLDARTGAYIHHFKLVAKDWHDWDVSTTPSLFKTWAGRNVMAVAPKDGHLYGFDLQSNALLYRIPVTRFDNADAPFVQGKPVHFCPGAIGGAEWNGPAYDPASNLVLVGEVDWCATVTLQTPTQIKAVKKGQPWNGNDSINPYHLFGTPDPYGKWAGWVYAVDADSGRWHWRAKVNYPVLSGMTPTAGGVTLFGDMGGNFHALKTATGQQLWSRKIGGAIGGGVITYTTHGVQRVAVATGFTSILWPTEQTSAKIVVLGVPNA